MDAKKSTSDDEDKKKQPSKPLASIGDTLSFVWNAPEGSPRLVFIIGLLAGVANGLVYPALAWLFSNSLSNVAGAATGDSGLDTIRELAFTFMVVGVYALVAATIQGWSFEHIAYIGSTQFRLQWFRALLRQDAAFFDVHDVGGIAAQVGPNALKYRRGFGRKFGEGVQFFTTGVGGIAYSFYASWKAAFVVLAVIPFASIAAMMVMKLNQQKGTSASKTYKRAGGVAYSTVAAIKTVLSLNAAPEMIRQYSEATAESFRSSKSILIAQGFWNGSMLGAFLLLYAILAVFGTFLIYREVEDNGCDPSGAISDNVTCPDSGPDVFGAMLGIAFAGQGISQVGNFFDAFAAARLATTEALIAIRRKKGAPAEVVYQDADEGGDKDELDNTTHSRKSRTKNSKGSDTDEEAAERHVKGVLPKYEIDSTSKEGKTPSSIQGSISFENVHFNYPTRPDDPVLKGLTVELEAGKIAAFCGPSGGGKSTVMSMIERFYDPLQGRVLLDGVDMKDINVTHLRKSIGYVGQEPTLFATSIKGNIRYGNPQATDEQVEQAARMANAHDFISNFTDGYDTQVGDKGSQLSGGQKQRIAIARVLVGDPKILLLDEATSALDSESELVVQEALDNIVAQKNITTVIIAHRLSTIRNADMINVIVGGVVAERGSHEALMAKDSYYRKLVEKQEGKGDDENSTPGSSRNNSTTDLGKLAEQASTTYRRNNDFGPPLLSFKNCNFAYPTRPKKLIFDGFDLDIYKGETVALVGPSGGGKSTTVGLIERFYDPNEGTLEYLGTDVKALNVAWYRDQIGYVGQEPTLFNDTIARNIAYGAEGATQAEIEHACKMANAHDFIMEFSEGYNTPLGETSQLSGGQKQRIAIARALVKKPNVLILDEATSALDNESEAVVQAAIDKLMSSSQHTVVMIAHRLSTIRNADKIAFVAEGKVLEYGSHDTLMERPRGRYKRLFESSKRSATAAKLRASTALKKLGEEEEEEEEIDWEAKIKEEEAAAFDAKRARSLAKPDISYMLIGSIGAVLAGGVFPMWGVLFSETITLLFTPVFLCPAVDGSIPLNFGSCDDYWDDIKDTMQEDSYVLAGYWAIVLVGCILGNMLTFYGFGTASERLNKRLRDSSFTALLRQEVAFFDMRTVGSITSQLQDDCARIHAFSGDPIRQMIVACSSVITGVVLSFVFMWQFALLALACVPFMGFATSMEMKQMLGEDEGDDSKGNAEKNTPGGIIVETLLNMRTVSALTMEEKRFSNYEKALLTSEPNHSKDALLGGVKAGLGQFIQQWINGLQMWFGGWLLIRFPDTYDFNDFLISNFAILFSLFGLGAAFQEMADKKLVEAAAGRIFYLFDRQSTIDPLADEGKRLKDGAVEALAIPDHTERDEDGDKEIWS